MIDSIHIALSGLHGFERGLKVIANNTANLNTPGFKSSSLQFADMYAGGFGSYGLGDFGLGLNTLGTVLSFEQGQIQGTNNGLDLAIDGLGFFVVQDRQGNLRYTRDGAFKFNTEGILVTATTEEEVMARDANGLLTRVSIANLRANDPAPTGTIVFGGNLSSAVTTATVGGVTVIDRNGSTHTLSVRFDAVAGAAGTWNVTVLEGNTTVANNLQIIFASGRPTPATQRLAFGYQLEGQDEIPITLDFSQNVTSHQAQTTSTLAMTSQTGHVAGTLTGTTFDGTGTLVLTYSNGETVRDVRLALARFDSPDAIQAVDDNRFEAVDGRGWLAGVAGENGFGSIRASKLEMSNVDLSQEFSELVIMQRGYQASSQIVSTANEMLAELFAMKGK